MSKLARISRYYADDKDILDLVSQPSISTAKLSELLRKRGIVVSPTLPKEALCDYIQRLPFSWPQINQLLEILDRPDREDRFTNCQINGDPTKLNIDAAIAALDLVKEARALRCNEVYKVSKISDHAATVTVEYAEADFSKTRLRQKNEKSLVISLESTPNGLQVRHQVGERGKEIIAEFQKNLRKEGEPEPARRDIVVTGLSSDKRSLFFVELARGIQGYKLVDQSKLSVNRADEQTDDDDDEDDTNEDEKEAQGLVKSAVLNGSALLSSADYQAYAKRGYAMSRLVWIAESEGTEKNWIEFNAEFENGKEGTGFRYGVGGKWESKEGGERTKIKRTVTPLERARLLKCIETSAYSALDKVNAAEPVAPPATQS